MTLPEKLVAIDGALREAELAHAFGGAIALAYWTRDPRGTSDIDVNIFVPAAEAEAALSALPKGVDIPDRAAERIAAEGQARLWWDGTPVDVFFDYVDIHAEAARNSRMVQFEGREIPVLGPVELAVFKAMFDRTRDWADIEAMVAAETLDIDAVRKSLGTMIGADDPRFERLGEAVRRGSLA